MGKHCTTRKQSGLLCRNHSFDLLRVAAQDFCVESNILRDRLRCIVRFRPPSRSSETQLQPMRLFPKPLKTRIGVNPAPFRVPSMTAPISSAERTFGLHRRVSAVSAFLRVGELLSLTCFAVGDGGSDRAPGFTVDTSSRKNVLALYHSVYGGRKNATAPADWTGNMSELLPGTTSTAFQSDVLRRVNFYRALAGVPANLTLNIEKSAKAQEAALLCARNNGLSHHPGHEHPEWAGLSQLSLGVEACAKSNLSLGAYGPAAVDGQIRDDGDANRDVGHRRWLLSPRLVEIGTGDVPEQPGFSAANAIWVAGAPQVPAANRFVLWPNRGYIPAGLLPSRWSVSHPGADFTAATVLMRRNGVPVPVRLTCKSDTPADSFQGERTLVWEPAAIPSAGPADVSYTVEVTGIRVGGMSRDLTYAVVAFDPDVLDETLAINGSGTVTPAGGSYVFNSIAQADGYELTVSRGSAEPWLEGAEGSGVQILTATAPDYAVVQSQVVNSGTSAFHLTHPGTHPAGFADQTFQLKRRLLPGPNSVLQFSETGRFAETTTTLNAEVSTDNGLSWTAVWSRTGVGLNSSLFDSGWNPHAIPLNAYQDQAVLVRFNLKSNGSPIAAGVTKDYGFFVDNIVLTKAVELVEARRTSLDGTATGFALNSVTAGARLLEGTRYYVSIAPRIGTRLFPSSALKVATVAAAPTLPDAGDPAFSSNKQPSH